MKNKHISILILIILSFISMFEFTSIFKIKTYASNQECKIAESITYKRQTKIESFMKGEIVIKPKNNSVTTYEAFWGKNNKVLEDYTAFAKVEKEANVLEECYITIPDGIIFPDGAEQIIVVANKLSDAENSYAIDIDKTNVAKMGKKLFSFNVMTDIHIKDKDVADSAKHSKHFSDAINEVMDFSEDSKAIFTIGDNTDNGKVSEYDHLFEIQNGVFEKRNKTIPFYYAIGNHDYAHGYKFDEHLERFNTRFNYEKVYYKTVIENTNFYTLGSDKMPSNGNWASLSREQLNWLENELKLNGKEKPCFIFLHQPLMNTISGTLTDVDPTIQDWYGVEQDYKLRTLVDAYPNVMFLTGHGHWELGANKNLNYGGGKTANYLNCASVGYLWNDLDVEAEGSEAMFVDVYENGVLFKGREFESKKWVGGARFYIPTMRSEKEEKEPTKGCSCNTKKASGIAGSITLLCGALIITKRFFI